MVSIPQVSAQPIQKTPLPSSVYFGAKKKDDAEGDEFKASKKEKSDGGLSASQKISTGIKVGLASMFDKDGLMSDTKWAIAFSIVGMVLPGSQLILIPTSYLLGMSLRFMTFGGSGYKNAEALQEEGVSPFKAVNLLKTRAD